MTLFRIRDVLRGPQVVGVVSLERIKAVPHAESSHTTVGEVMTPLTERLVVWPEEPLRDALRKLGRKGLGRAVVLDGGARGLERQVRPSRHRAERT